jgi:ADP-ribosylglycohydrolase
MTLAALTRSGEDAGQNGKEEPTRKSPRAENIGDFAWHAQCSNSPMLDRLDPPQRARLRSCLLATAMGDALGFPYQGLCAAEIAASQVERSDQSAPPQGSYVADQTVPSALVLASLLHSDGDVERAQTCLRRALLGWFSRVPFSASATTAHACLRILIGCKETGIACANHEPAMRASVIGACFPHEDARRRALARALARVTHRDARAVEAAVFVAELSALCGQPHDCDRAGLVVRAAACVRHSALREAIEGAVQLALFKDDALDLAHEGDDALETVRVCVWAFVRHGHAPLEGMCAAVSVGGATRSAAAIVGAWLGLLHGEAALPRAWLEFLQDRPLAPGRLHALVVCADHRAAPRYSNSWALTRNLSAVLGWSRTRLLSR